MIILGANPSDKPYRASREKFYLTTAMNRTHDLRFTSPVGGCFTLANIHYYKCATKCVMKYKLIPHYKLGSTGIRSMFAKN